MALPCAARSRARFSFLSFHHIPSLAFRFRQQLPQFVKNGARGMSPRNRSDQDLFEVPVNDWPHRNQYGDDRQNAYKQASIKPFGLMRLRGAFLLFQFGKLLPDPFAGLLPLFITIQGLHPISYGIIRPHYLRSSLKRRTPSRYALGASSCSFAIRLI
jgi:hypothetical protein